MPALVVILLFATSDLAAQQPPDTLRYHEVTRSVTVLRAPGGEVRIGLEQDARITWLRITRDSAVAWYTALTLTATSPSGTERPTTAGLLGRRFVLRIDDDGHVVPVRTPTLPPDIRRLSDLSRQFLDFFLPVAPTALRPGLVWRDTVRLDGAESAGGSAPRLTATKQARYEVTGDTVVGGVPAWVVRAHVQQRFRTETPLEDRPEITVVNLMEGPEYGAFWVAKTDGRLLRRTREAELRGVLDYQGASAPLILPVERRYESTIRCTDGCRVPSPTDSASNSP
ncbi:MAG: hypothetical protein ACRELV_07000 [Longimicrobiales bacterium]